jgi:hypothetical protein
VDVAKAENGFVVTLDSRPLKTPSGNKLHLPQSKRILAMLVATEWENQDKILKTHTLPMVGVSACQTTFRPLTTFRARRRWFQGRSTRCMTNRLGFKSGRPY